MPQIYSFQADGSFQDLQDFGKKVYSVPDDRMFSLSDLLSNQERFIMRALKGMRKGNTEKLKKNLLIGGSWLIEIANRMHIDLEDSLWERFPGVCSYCGNAPCICKSIKQEQRKKVRVDASKRPRSVAAFQQMFNTIYPQASRTIYEAGVHLAEEIGEVSEAIHAYSGEHKAEQFSAIEDEIADEFSCIMGVANSAGIDVAQGYAEMYYQNCHVCHEAPCVCNFSFITKFNS